MRRRLLKATIAAAAALAALVVIALFAARGPADRFDDAPRPAALAAGATQPATPGEWPAFGRDPGGSQFSPLAQIDRGNVGRLERAWEHRSGDFALGAFPVGTSLEVTPIQVNGLLYACTPFNRVVALDPATGRQRWAFDPFARQPDGPPIVTGKRRNGTCRGVSYWQDAGATGVCSKRIYRGDMAGRLFAIDADTGRTCRGFGGPSHAGYVSHFDFDNFAKDEGSSFPFMGSPPAVIGDLVIVGGLANDGVQDTNDGIIRAFDARSGALRWQFDPIPPAYRHRTGAANVWSTLSVDVKNGLVFVPTTSPSTDYYGGARRFPLPYANAVVALDAATGRVVWSYQTVHHDLWDFDLPGHALLVTIRRGGRPIDVAIQQTKMGRLFVFERRTGRLVFPVDERPVPASPLPDDRAAPTQPEPRLPEHFARTRVTRDEMFGVVGLDKLWCRNAFDETRYQGTFTPPGLDPFLQLPSTLGGGNWGGAAYDPATNSLIIKSANIPTRLQLVRKRRDVKPAMSDFMTRPLDGPYAIVGDWFTSPLGIPCTPPPYGTLTAIDMDSGKIRWQRALGQTMRHGVTVPAFMRWGSPSVGGPMVTAGGVVFIAATLDGKFRAFDAWSGRTLWTTRLPYPGAAVPMTYAVGGRQYVVIAAGGDAKSGMAPGDALVAYALPRR